MAVTLAASLPALAAVAIVRNGPQPQLEISQRQDGTLHVEWADDGGFFRAFTFHWSG